MDLTHDWKALNEVLFQGATLTKENQTLVLVEQEGKIIDGLISDGRKFSTEMVKGIDSISKEKAKLDEVCAQLGLTQTLVLSKKKLDQYFAEVSNLGSNYYQQLEHIRSKIQSDLQAQNSSSLISRKHFILDLFTGPWVKLLPRNFNVLIFIDQRPSIRAIEVVENAVPIQQFQYKAILLHYSYGKLHEFYEPDFSSLHENRLLFWQKEYSEIGQYLESRYILPCYGFFMYQEDLDRCQERMSENSGKVHPFRTFVRLYDEGRSRIFPQSWIARTLLAFQRVLVYFGRL